MSNKALTVLVLLLGLAAVYPAWATETENLGLRVLPAPAVITVDGRSADWDLSGGIFACGDCETQRDKFAVWFHANYDAEKLYILCRWSDPTPMNNPYSSKGDLCFNGDCLQFRIIAGGDRCSHWTCYRDRDGIDLMDVAYGTRFNEGGIRDAKTKGAAQAFGEVTALGYTQEIAIPWKLLVKDGLAAPKAGEKFTLTIEPNFTVGINGRITVKDIFKPGVKIDRVFTFMGSPCWGTATLEAKGRVTPAPLRLADNREFPVAMVDNQPRIDWTGLIKKKELLGFKPVAFTAPADGFVSLLITDGEGNVVRHLLNSAFYTAGKHTVNWDGTSDPVFRTPGRPVAAGQYQYKVLFHKGLGLNFRGFASCDGAEPWDAGPASGWGGDHGVPAAAVAAGKTVFLGWTGAEAGKALLACDLEGTVLWRNTRGGIGGASLLARDGNDLYVLNPGNAVYRLSADKGAYVFWEGTESADLSLGAFVPGAKSVDGLAARGGKLYLSFARSNLIAVADSKSGKPVKTLDIPAPGQLAFARDGKLLVLSGGKAVLAVDVESGAAQPQVDGLAGATALTVDAEGRIYVGGDEKQVKVYDPTGQKLLTIGMKGGRPARGVWQAEGMDKIAGLAVDAAGKLWVMEGTENPKRVSVWEARSGKLLQQLFGPTHYGASGGAVNPLDPNLMVGEGCEWRLDPKSGRGTCTGVFEVRPGGFAGFARFATPANGRLYLVTSQMMHGAGDYRIYERVGEGDYKLRSSISTARAWADQNDDGQVQEHEVSVLPGGFQASGYIGVSAFVNTDLSFIGTLNGRGVWVKPTGFTTCGAPTYDFAQAQPAPAVGQPSLDNRFVLEWSDNWISCFDVASGKKRWTYPNTFSGVHGSHLAPGPELGLLRGSFGSVGAAQLPGAGAVWALNGNCGEWYLFTGEGFFLAQLFQGDGTKVQWPVKALPGASLDNCPPGLGGEDFGGSLTQAKDGKVYVQAGKIGLWNVEVTGLDTIQALPGGRLSLDDNDTRQALAFREKALQDAAGAKRVTLAKMTPVFTGKLDDDFKGAPVMAFKKQDDAAARCAVAFDADRLYVAWEVADRTPWVNGAAESDQLYLAGDTVDLQLGADPTAPKGRAEAVAGDLRLSIGNFKGKPTAVLYRPVSADKKPKTFHSGVVKDYRMDYVAEVDTTIEVKVKENGGYVVEAAIPLSTLGIRLQDGLALTGDFGVTHGDAGGQRTRLRSYWSNVATGIVDDAVFELKMEPKNWGVITFP
jgi:hypothetical protein